MKTTFALFVTSLFVSIHALAAAPSSDLPFSQWTVRCEGSVEELHGAPYRQTIRTIFWDLSAQSSMDSTEVRIFAPFTDPEWNGKTDKTIKNVTVTPLFSPGCRTQCDAQQLAVHLNYVISGMQDGVGMSADYTEVILPTQSLTIGSSVTLKNSWAGVTNDCDRGGCLRDISGSETLNCTVQNIQN